MLSRFRRLPSPALVIASIALIVAVGGGSFALAISDRKSDKRIAKRVANKQITKRAPHLSVNHANTADHASDVNGVSLGHFFATDPVSTGAHTIATIGPLTLQGSCDASGKPELRGAVNETSNQHGDVYGNTSFGTATLPANTFTSLTVNQVPFGGQGVSEFLTYGSHRDIKVEWYVRDAGAFGPGSGCFYTGYVTTD